MAAPELVLEKQIQNPEELDDEDCGGKGGFWGHFRAEKLLILRQFGSIMGLLSKLVATEHTYDVCWCQRNQECKKENL